MEYTGLGSQPIKDCLAKADDFRNRASEVLKPVKSLGPVSMLAALAGGSQPLGVPVPDGPRRSYRY